MNINRQLFLCLTIVVLSFGFGISVGITTANGTRQPCPPSVTPRASPTAAVVVAQCDTDTDCLEKFGCGGYADPCELPPVNTQLDPYCRKHPKARACDAFCKRVDCRE